MLSESHLVSFLDEKCNYVIHFFDGQKLIADMTTIHLQKGEGFKYFRDCVLAAQPMISFLKPGESFGFYIDNENPFFRFKLETGQNGLTRFLLLPGDFSSPSNTLNGKGRLTKIFRGAQPYTSIIDINGLTFLEVVNHVLSYSYQVDSKVFLSPSSDQSVLITKLPMALGPSSTNTKMTLTSYQEKMETFFNEVFSKNLSEPEEIKNCFTSSGFTFLQSRAVKFSCPCQKETMVQSLRNLQQGHFEELFASGEDHLDIQCDYCHSNYVIQKSELVPANF